MSSEAPASLPPGIEVIEKYPHVVVRWIAACYGCKHIRFEGEPERINTIAVPCRRDAPDMREVVIETVHAHVVRYRFRMCVVFGPKDVCFLEPDGSRNFSDDRPSGGVRIDGFQHEQSPAAAQKV